MRNRLLFTIAFSPRCLFHSPSRELPLTARKTVFSHLNEGCARGELGKGDKNTVWGDKNNDTLMGQLKVLQKKAAKVLLNLPPRSSSTKALVRLDLKNLSKRRHFHRCVMIRKYLSGEIDLKFDIRRDSSFRSCQTRRSNDFTPSSRAHQLGQANFHFSSL